MNAGLWKRVRRVLLPSVILLGWMLPASFARASGASETGGVDSFYGAFGTEIPITVPSFRGLEPRLKLVYTSTGQNGFMGVGWSLAGTSVITRASEGKGVANYDASDIFLLDGTELVPCTTLGGTHCTKIQNYHRITFDSGANEWYVWRKDGTKATYGSSFGTSQGTYRWAVKKVEDTRGNAVYFSYWTESGYDVYLDHISYNNTVIQLYRESRPDEVKLSTGVSFATTRYRLKTIDVKVGGSRARSYKFSYATSGATGRSLLTSVTQYGRDATLDGSGTVTGGTSVPAMTFAWDEADNYFVSGSGMPGANFAMPRGGSSANTGYSPGGLTTGDFNGDGRTDLIWALWECDDNYGSGCEAHRGTWLRTETGWVAGPTPPGGYFAMHRGGSSADAGYSDAGMRVADINGDGKDDLLWSLWECDANWGAGCEAHKATWLSTGSGWTAGPNIPADGYFAMPRGGSSDDAGYTDGGLRIADINGDGKADLLLSLWECDDNWGAGCEGHKGTWLSTGSGWTAGPGMPGNAYFAMSAGGSVADAGYSDGGLRLADLNGDGKADLIWALWECNSNYGDNGCEAHRDTWLSTGSGWTAGPEPAGGGYFAMPRGGASQDVGYTDGGLRLADLNGDGLTDLLWSLWECDENWGAGCEGHRATYLNRGDTFVSGPALPVNAYFAMPRADSSANTGYTDGGLRIGDINGDGKADLIWALWECDDNYGAGCEAHKGTWLGTGAGWITGPSSIGGGYFAMPRGGSNGDGGYTDGGLRIADIDGNGKDDLIWSLYECDQNWESGCEAHRATYPSGGGHDLVDSMANGVGGTTDITYEPSSAWDNTYLPVGLVMQTASAVTTSDGRGNSSTTSYVYEGGLWSSTERRFLGFRKVTAVLDAAGNYTETYYHQHVGCIAKPETTYFKDAQGNIYSYSQMSYSESSSAPYTSLMTDRWDYECNLDASCRRVLSKMYYDTYGNITQLREYGDYDVSGDERTTLNSYKPNTSGYIVGLSAYTNVYEGLGTGGQLVKRTLRYFDGNGSYADPPVYGAVTKVRKWNSATGAYHNAYASYDGYGNTVSETDAEGNSISRTFDSTYHMFVTQTCNEEGHCQSSVYDAVLGQRTSVVDANGNTTSFQYDALGRPTQTTAPNGSVTTYQYYSYGNPNYQRHRVTKNGFWTDTYFDGAQRVWKKRKANGHQKLTQFSDLSQRIWRESQWYDSAAGESARYTTYAYDGAGRIRTVTLPDGEVAERIYDDGQVTTVDENGNEKTVWKDPYGRTTKVHELNGSSTYSTTYEYDMLDHPTRVVDNGGKESTATWDSLGRKLSSCDMDMGCWSYEYDNVGNLVAQTDAKGQAITMTWDGLHRTLSKTYPNGATTSFYYDEDGYGESIGRLTRVTYPGGSKSMKYDNMGRSCWSKRCVDSVCKTVTSTFDSMNRLATLSYPDGESVTYAYDGSSRLDSISGYVSGIDYDARGQITSISYTNGTTQTYSYDTDRHWLLDSVMTNSSGVQYQAHYDYDGAGRVTSVSSNTDSLANVSYSYDGLDRLTAVSGAQSQTFSYWAIGNIGNNSDVGSYSYGDSAHRHAVTNAGGVSYGYDANGNMTSGAGRSLAWDAENRLASVTMGGLTTSFAYDDVGQRIKKSGPNGTTRYFGLVEVNPAGTLVKYIVANGQVVAKKEGSAKYFYHRDRLDSVQVVTNANGSKVRSNEFAAYGSLIETSGSHEDAFGFGGHRTDEETGLVYMNARYYDPDLGRFISPDSMVPGDFANPQARNRYSYAFNNPISNKDPTGHAPVAAAIIGAAIGVATGVISVTVAVVAVACVAIGYVTKNPLLMSIGQVILGFATGGVLGGVVAALTSPISPLDPKIKMIIGWAYTVYCIVRTIDAQVKQARMEAASRRMGSDTEILPENESQRILQETVSENDQYIARATESDFWVDNVLPGHQSHTQVDYYRVEIAGDGTLSQGDYLFSGVGNANGRGMALNAEILNPTHVIDQVVISGTQVTSAISAAYGPGSYLTNFVCHNVVYAQLAVFHGATQANTMMNTIGWQWSGWAGVRYHTPSGGSTNPNGVVYEGGFWGDGTSYEFGP